MGKGVPRLKTGEAVVALAFIACGGAGWPGSDGNAGAANASNPDPSSGGAQPYWQPKPDGNHPHLWRPTYITAHGYNTEWPNNSSVHAGKVGNSVMADGSVRGISPNIEYITYQKLNAHADGKQFRNYNP
jgi:prepilin-type processing-associated H-X9-DG protein